MERRKLLGVAGIVLVVLLAGCSAAGSLDLAPASDDAVLAEQTSRSTAIPDEGPVRSQQVVQRAIENGSATAQSSDPLVEPGLPFEHQDSYYNVSWNVVDREQGISAGIAIDYNGTATDNETVAYSELSATDRQVLDTLLPPLTSRYTDGYDFEISGTYNRTEQSRSVLLSEEYDAVQYEGDRYPVKIEDTRTVTTRTYRYTATPVANSSSKYASQVREEYLLTLSDLSDDEQDILEEAIDETYYADSEDDDAFRSLAETITGHEAIDANEFRGTWLVRYDGETYLVDLSYEQFDVTPQSG